MPNVNGNGRGAPKHLILASGSRTRQSMLHSAGIAHTVIPADLDEAAIRQALTGDTEDVDPSDIAEVLARAKAEHVSGQDRDGLVIGSDQVLALNGEIFEKPATVEAAQTSLLKLRGHTHQLHTAVALASQGEVVWSYVETAHITMRNYSEKSLAEYLVKAGDIVCESVGGYQLEGLGVQLMEKVDGNHFTILGMPLLPLLNELRDRGMVDV
ncbi:MAG: Maf family nucleotide pyrophosphatase [Hyphomicrobiaceae bacterium]